MLRLVSMLVAAATLTAACGDDGATAPSTTEAPPSSVAVGPSTTTTSTTTTVAPATPVTREAIMNAAVSIDGETVTLVDGRGEGPPFVRVVGTVIGDVTGDGVDDGAAVLAHDYPGTTGRFSSLALFHQPAETLLHTEPIVYVDRGRTHDLRLDGNLVALRWSELMFNDDGVQSRSAYRFDADTGELAVAASETFPLVDARDSGFFLDTSTPLDFGATPAEARTALHPVLGDPTEESTAPTCWGREDGLYWEHDGSWLSMSFREDEWYSWATSDPIFVTAGIASPGSSRHWLEQIEATTFEFFVSEIGGGTHSDRYGSGVEFADDEREVVAVSGRWESDFDRLHTVILDPFENPDLWCGD